MPLPKDVEEHLRSMVRAEYWIATSKNSLPNMRALSSGRRQGYCELLELLGLKSEADAVIRGEIFKLKGGQVQAPTKKDYKQLRKEERTMRRVILPGSRIESLRRYP